MKILLIITEILIGSGSAIGSSGVGIIISGSIALLTSIASLITNEYISKLKITFTKLRDWVFVFKLVYETTLKQSMIDKKID